MVAARDAFSLLVLLLRICSLAGGGGGAAAAVAAVSQQGLGLSEIKQQALKVGDKTGPA